MGVNARFRGGFRGRGEDPLNRHRNNLTTLVKHSCFVFIVCLIIVLSMAVFIIPFDFL